MDYIEIISTRTYNRESEKYGKYKVIKYLGLVGKSHKYTIKFKDSGNVKDVSIALIKSGKVIDTELKAKTTKKNNRLKKKESKASYNEKVKYLHQPRNLLSLDLASVSTGYCVARKGKIKDYGYFYMQSHTSGNPSSLTERLNFMKVNIIKLIKKYKIDSVVVESVPFLGNQRVLFVLAQIRSLIIDYCYENDIQTISIEPRTWEYSMWDNRFGDLDTKEKNLQTALKDYKIDFRKKFSGKTTSETRKKVWEDPCDAFLIMQYTLKNRIREY